MALVGSIITTKEFKPIVPFKGVDKTDLYLIFCNTAVVDNYIFVSWHKGDIIVNLYFNYPVLAYDTYPRDNSPFRISLGINDQIFVRSTTPGIEVSLLK